MKLKLTKAERGVVKRLHNLHFVWPDSWWLDISTGGVHIMRYDESGKPEYVATVDIPNAFNSGAFGCDLCGEKFPPSELRASANYKHICRRCFELSGEAQA